jgi:hypothetical protein
MTHFHFGTSVHSDILGVRTLTHLLGEVTSQSRILFQQEWEIPLRRRLNLKKKKKVYMYCYIRSPRKMVSPPNQKPHHSTNDSIVKSFQLDFLPKHDQPIKLSKKITK